MNVVEALTARRLRSDGEDGAPPSPRLNPFALPTDTTSRFALLVVAVLSASLFAYMLLSFALPSTQERLVRAEQCAEARVAATPVPPTAGENDRTRIVDQARLDCRRPVLRWEALIVGAGVGALTLIAVGLYALVPTWKIRRRRLVPLEEEDAPELVERFRQLCREAGLARPPRLLWNPLTPGSSALAFGRFNRSYVAVGAGLVVQYYTEPDAAVAVLRHELAHVVNRDVSKTYLAFSLWYAFVLAGLLPLVAAHLVEGGVLSFPTVWRLAALVGLVYAARNAVLRTREYYADAWAGSSRTARTVLAKILQRLPEAGSKGLRRLRTLGGVHPDPASRVRALANSARLFRPRFADVFAAGVLAGFAYPTVREFLFLLFPIGQTLSIPPTAALVSASLIGVVLGTVVWRAGLAARARDRAHPGTAPLAVAAAVGLALGSQLSFGGWRLNVASTLVLLLFMLPTVHWLAATADAWFDSVPGTRSGRTFSAAGLVAAGLVVWNTAWVSTLGVGDRADTTENSAPFVAGYIASHRATPFVVAGLVLFPLAAIVLGRRARSEATPSWVVEQEGPGEAVPWPQRPRLAVASTLLCGAAGGIVFCLGVVAIRALDVSAGSLVKPIEEAAFQYAPATDHALIALAVVAQIVVSAVVALRAKRLAVLHALLALPASFVLMTVGVVLPGLLDGDGLPVGFTRLARLVLTGGALAALVVGAGVDALRRAPRLARVPLLGVAAVALALVMPWGGRPAPEAPPAATPDVRLTPREAHQMVVEEIRDDPAITEFPFETFDTSSRTLCLGLEGGVSAAEYAEGAAREPTRRGIPMQLESARTLAAAGIRAYCPQHASQLADLDRTPVQARP